MSGVSESTVEQAALAWLESAGWRIAHGPAVAPDAPSAGPADHSAVVLKTRSRDPECRTFAASGDTILANLVSGELVSGELRLADVDSLLVRIS